MISKHNILVVDNNDDVRESLRMILEHNGYTVLTAGDPDTANRLLSGHDIDLAIIDLRLIDDADVHDTSGLELANKLAHTKAVILLTGYPRPPVNDLHRSASWISKMHGPQVLLDKVKTLINELELVAAITLVPADGFVSQKLTAFYLSNTVSTYLIALTELQHVIDKISGKITKDILIKSISQNSPITIGLQGAAEAAEVVRDVVIPWRREHAKKLAQLEEEEKLSQIEIHRAEILERRAHAQKERIETKKTEGEIDKERTDADIYKARLENEKLLLEIQEKRIDLALKVIDNLAPQLSDTQRITYVVQLLAPLGVITSSPIQIGDDASPNGE